MRDIDTWLTSITSHFKELDDIANPAFTRFICTVAYGAWQVNEHRFRQVYQRHLENVRAYFQGRSEDFLVLDIVGGEGWETLCPFLGVTAPNQPFPYANTSRENLEWRRRIDQLSADVLRCVPNGARFVLIDDGDVGHKIAPERESVSMPRPQNEEAAVRELRRLSQRGFSFVVVAWPYKEVIPLLEQHCEPVFQNDSAEIFKFG